MQLTYRNYGINATKDVGIFKLFFSIHEYRKINKFIVISSEFPTEKKIISKFH